MTANSTVGPKYVKPTVPMAPGVKEQPPESIKESDGWKTAQPRDQGLQGNGWEIFGDPQLNALEEEVTLSNQDLKVAEARFRQARAVIHFNRSAEFPTISTSLSIANERLSANQPYFPQFLANNGAGSFTLPFDLPYEVDSWGRFRHTISASRDKAQASAADLQTADLSLFAELAVDFFELRSADLQEQLLDDTVKAYTDALKVTQNRFDGGAAPKSDVAQTQPDGARVQHTDITVMRSQYERAVATLIGEPPAEFNITPAPKTALQLPVIPVGVPASLLERRPDIAAGERRVAEANDQIGKACAAFFPSLVFGATGGFAGTSITNWLNWPSRMWAVGPQMSQTIFDAGRRRAVFEGATANYDGTVASYRQTTLTAFQGVEDNLAALRILDKEAQQQLEATASAEDSLQLFTKRYQGGVDNYLEVITAQTAALLTNQLSAMTSTLSGDAWIPASFSSKLSAADRMRRSCRGSNE
jgi:NodT family efflux transporter outer membrane factor (OMF) lipoprotein